MSRDWEMQQKLEISGGRLGGGGGDKLLPSNPAWAKGWFSLGRGGSIGRPNVRVVVVEDPSPPGGRRGARHSGA